MKMRVLYFDMECRPGHWIGGDYVSKVVTAAAWSWNDEKKVAVRDHYDFSPGEIAFDLAEVVEEADMVCGHYIRGFDLPLLNGELLRGHMEPLTAVLALDTKMDLTKAGGRSKSQENLAALLNLEEPKIKVNLANWEAFNGREDNPAARAKVVERVRGDVIQNRALRKALIKAGWLGPPHVWRPESSGGGMYRP